MDDLRNMNTLILNDVMRYVKIKFQRGCKRNNFTHISD